MITMDNMIVLELGAHQQIANDTGVVRNFNTDGIIDCPHRGQSMGIRSDAAGALHKMVGVAGISTLQDDLNAPEHLT